jgi:hypothetical protein
VSERFWKHLHVLHFEHGKPEEEAAPQDVEAQTQKAFESQSAQEAHLAEVGGARLRFGR